MENAASSSIREKEKKELSGLRLRSNKTPQTGGVTQLSFSLLIMDAGCDAETQTNGRRVIG